MTIHHTLLTLFKQVHNKQWYKKQKSTLKVSVTKRDTCDGCFVLGALCYLPCHVQLKTIKDIYQTATVITYIADIV